MEFHVIHITYVINHNLYILWIIIFPHIDNTQSPGKYGSNLKSVISKHMLQIKFMSNSCEIALYQMPQNTFDDKPTLVQVMACCLTAWRQQAITWANVDPDLCHHIASQGHHQLCKYKNNCIKWNARLILGLHPAN